MRKKQQRTFIDKCFRDNDGKVVIAQAPNYAIIIWLLCFILQLFSLPLSISNGIYYAGNCFLFLWAWLETYSGVNYFRRLLGLAVLFMLILPQFTR